MDPDGIGGSDVTTKGWDVTSPRKLVVCEVDAVDADKNGTCDNVGIAGSDVTAKGWYVISPRKLVVCEVDVVNADKNGIGDNVEIGVTTKGSDAIGKGRDVSGKGCDVKAPRELVFAEDTS